MRSIDVANMIISRYSGNTRITNLSLNKLVYFAQVESLKRRGDTLFDDRIEAWDFGPVEPLVYRSFKKYGRSPITEPSIQDDESTCDCFEYASLVDSVMETYGSLTAFDLVEVSHREGGAWSKKYSHGLNAEITVDDIIESDDFKRDFDAGATFLAGIRNVKSRWPNTLKLLEDA